MKTLKTKHYTTSQCFTITSSEVNNNNALLTNVLYEKMTVYMEAITSNMISEFNTNPRLYQLKVLKNAFKGETLEISSYVENLIGEDLTITVLVQSKNSKRNNTICKAIFKLPIKSALHHAS